MTDEAPETKPKTHATTLVYFLVYDQAGRILRNGACHLHDLGHQAHAPGETAAASTRGAVNDADSYILDGVVTARPVLIVGGAAGRVITLHGVPVGCDVFAGAEKFIADDPDGSLSITVPCAGTYTVHADPFPGRHYFERFAIA